MITSNLMNKNVYSNVKICVPVNVCPLSSINFRSYCKISPWKMCFLTLSVSKTGKFWMLSGHQYHNWKKSENLIASSSFGFLSLTLRMSYHVQLSITLHNFPGMTLKAHLDSWLTMQRTLPSRVRHSTSWSLISSLNCKISSSSTPETPQCVLLLASVKLQCCLLSCRDPISPCVLDNFFPFWDSL